jgi:hypothetical protein
VEERLDSIPSATFQPRYEVGWIPDGRLSFVPIELNTVVVFFDCVRSLETHITSVYMYMFILVAARVKQNERLDSSTYDTSTN